MTNFFCTKGSIKHVFGHIWKKEVIQPGDPRVMMLDVLRATRVDDILRSFKFQLVVIPATCLMRTNNNKMEIWKCQNVQTEFVARDDWWLATCGGKLALYFQVSSTLVVVSANACLLLISDRIEKSYQGREWLLCWLGLRDIRRWSFKRKQRS